MSAVDAFEAGAARPARRLATIVPEPAALGAAVLLAMAMCHAVGCVPAVGPRVARAEPVAPVARPRPGLPTVPAALPRTVEVSLDGGVGAVGELEVVEVVGEIPHHLRATTEGVVLDGKPPARRARVPGPVSVGTTVHEGDLWLEAVPGRAEMRAVAVLPLEAYVAGVVAAELPLWSAQTQELAAQAVAARTYAVRAILTRDHSSHGGPPRLTDGVLDQAYRGTYRPRPASPRTREIRARLDAAIELTRGVVLARGDLLEDVRYHASCGGATADLLDVFGAEPGARAGSAGVPCAPCTARARAEAEAGRPDPERPLGWVERLGPDALARLGAAAGLTGPAVTLAPTRRDRTGRWLAATVTDGAGARATLDLNGVRRAVGFTTLPGSRIVALRPSAGARMGPEGLLVQGRGRGHGVGLCQEALRDLALEGWPHTRILAHYYPGTRPVRISPELP